MEDRNEEESTRDDDAPVLRDLIREIAGDGVRDEGYGVDWHGLQGWINIRIPPFSTRKKGLEVPCIAPYSIHIPDPRRA